MGIGSIAFPTGIPQKGKAGDESYEPTYVTMSYEPKLCRLGGSETYQKIMDYNDN